MGSKTKRVLATAKRKGRSAKSEAERATVNLTMRLRPDLYESLRRSAEENGRSISAQAERRLSSEEPSAIARLVDAAISAIEQRAGKGWREDELVRRKCRAAADYVLDLMLGDPITRQLSLRPYVESELSLLHRYLAGEDRILAMLSVKPSTREDAEKMVRHWQAWLEANSLAKPLLEMFQRDTTE